MKPLKGAGAFDLRYALVEITLITVGVLIALAASDWQNNREAWRTEIAILDEIHRSLSEDEEALNRLLEHSVKSQNQSNALLERLKSNVPYSSESNREFGMLYCLNRPLMNNAAYESLKSNSLLLISNQSLRSQIAHVYEVTYRRVAQELDSERTVVWDILGPYIFANFYDVRACASAIPLDYEQIKADQLFHNLVEIRMNGQATIYGPVWSNAIKDVRNLSEAISTELRM